MQRQSTAKAVNALCRKTLYCPSCRSTNGVIKKSGALRIVHEKFRAKKTSDEAEEFKRSFDSATKAMPELKTWLGKAVEDMNPLRVLELFRKISSEVSQLSDMAVLDVSTADNHAGL